MNIVDGWLDAAIEVDCMQKSMSREGHKITHIVLHGTAGGSSAENIANYFRTSNVEASAHFVIGQDGHVIQCVDCSIAAWANGIILNPRIPWDTSINPNLFSVSIEHCKASQDNSDELTPAQKLASFQVINAICDYYSIPKRRGDVHGGLVSHADFDSINRARCPGPYPWDELIAFLNGGSSMIPTGWHDDSHTLTAPNGIPVRLGFRDYVLARNWDANNWPLQAEEGRAQIELSNPDLGAGTWQPFKWKVLEYTPSHGVFEAWCGAELLVTRKLLQAITTPPADIVTLLTTLLAATEQLQGEIAAALKQLQPAP